MSRRSRHDSTTPTPSSDTAAMLARWTSPAQIDLLRQLCLAAAIGLYIITALIPSEGAAAKGTGLVIVMLWILLGGTWILEGLLRGRLEVRASWTGTAMIGLVGWHAVSTFATAGEGNARYATNMLWEWIGIGTGFLLLRSLVQSEKQVRAIVAIMIGLAVLLSVFSFYQYFHTMPKERARYEADPQVVMREAGVYYEKGTPQYESFRNRVNSPEPTATFALTNSLANVLVPWLVVGMGLLLLAWHGNTPSRSTLFGMGICLVPILFSLLLTQSRTGYIAAALGVALVWVYGRANVSRQMWIVPIAAVGMVLIMGVAAGLSGGLSTELVGGASKTLLHRLEYWQSTAAMIDAHPFFGTGPGNFQDYYTAHQLPQASESVADPHNFLLEIWATAGSPALFALLAVLGFFTWEAARGSASQEAELSAEEAAREKAELEALAEEALRRDVDAPPSDEDDKPKVHEPDNWDPSVPGYRFIYVGALFGVLLAWPIGFVVGFPPDALGLFAVGLPAAAACVWLLTPWVDQGKLPITVLAAGVVVMLVSLLVSGGINFPGVAGSLWILVGLTLYIAERHKPAYVLPPPVAMMGLVLAFGLALLCHQTAYEPVLTARAWLGQGDSAFQEGQYTEAEAAYKSAAAADSFTPEPWERLANFYHNRWIAAPADLRSPTLFQEFEKAKKKAVSLNKHSASLQREIGRWYLQAYRSSGNEEYLQSSIAAFKQVVTLFPNNAMDHAQLAWVHHLARDVKSASAAAAEAVRLDKLNVRHEEHKLANQSIFDPGPNIQPRTAMLPGPGARTAGKVMEDDLYR